LRSQRFSKGAISDWRRCV
jgi:large subunit ribosomal protein L22e